MREYCIKCNLTRFKAVGEGCGEGGYHHWEIGERLSESDKPVSMRGIEIATLTVHPIQQLKTNLTWMHDLAKKRIIHQFELADGGEKGACARCGLLQMIGRGLANLFREDKTKPIREAPPCTCKEPRAKLDVTRKEQLDKLDIVYKQLLELTK
jgi:hypothetical protein